jgi:hypothetical protein
MVPVAQNWREKRIKKKKKERDYTRLFNKFLIKKRVSAKSTSTIPTKASLLQH